LLRAYPPSYRRRWGDEIVATLAETAGPGRAGPRAADLADLVGSGVRQRLALIAPGCAAGLRRAAPFALALAGGISAYLWWRVEPTGPFLGSWRTAAPVAYAGWLSAVGLTAVRPALGRVAIASAVGLTLAVPGVSVLTTVERPPLWVLSVLVGLGLVALMGRQSTTTVDERLAVPAGTVAVVTVSVAVDRIWPVAGPTYYQPTIARVGIVLGLAAAVVLAVALRPPGSGARTPRLDLAGLVRLSSPVRLSGAVGASGRWGVSGRLRAPGRSMETPDHPRAVSGEGRSWLWAATLLAVLAGWLGPATDGGGGPRFGRLAEVLLASCVAAVALSGLAGTGRARRADRSPAPDPLGGAGSLVLGCAIGLGTFLGVGAGGGFGFVGRGRADDYPLATVGLVALAGLFAVLGARRFHIRGAAMGAGGAGVAAWAVAAYDNDWTVRGWVDFGRTADLVATVALVPLFLCAVVAARSLIRPGQGGRRFAAAGALAVSLGWIGLATVPYAAAWGPQLAVLLACLAVEVRSGGEPGPGDAGVLESGREMRL